MAVHPAVAVTIVAGQAEVAAQGEVEGQVGLPFEAILHVGGADRREVGTVAVGAGVGGIDAGAEAAPLAGPPGDREAAGRVDVVDRTDGRGVHACGVVQVAAVGIARVSVKVEGELLCAVEGQAEVERAVREVVAVDIDGLRGDGARPAVVGLAHGDGVLRPFVAQAGREGDGRFLPRAARLGRDFVRQGVVEPGVAQRDMERVGGVAHVDEIESRGLRAAERIVGADGELAAVLVGAPREPLHRGRRLDEERPAADSIGRPVAVVVEVDILMAQGQFGAQRDPAVAAQGLFVIELDAGAVREGLYRAEIGVLGVDALLQRVAQRGQGAQRAARALVPSRQAVEAVEGVLRLVARPRELVRGFDASRDAVVLDVAQRVFGVRREAEVVGGTVVVAPAEVGVQPACGIVEAVAVEVLIVLVGLAERGIHVEQVGRKGKVSLGPGLVAHLVARQEAFGQGAARHGAAPGRAERVGHGAVERLTGQAVRVGLEVGHTAGLGVVVAVITHFVIQVDVTPFLRAQCEAKAGVHAVRTQARACFGAAESVARREVGHLVRAHIDVPPHVRVVRRGGEAHGVAGLEVVVGRGALARHEPAESPVSCRPVGPLPLADEVEVVHVGREHEALPAVDVEAEKRARVAPLGAVGQVGVERPRTLVVGFQVDVHHVALVAHVAAHGLAALALALVDLDLAHDVGRQVLQGQLGVAVEEVLAAEQDVLDVAAVDVDPSVAQLGAGELFDEVVEHRAVGQVEGVGVIY